MFRNYIIRFKFVYESSDSIILNLSSEKIDFGGVYVFNFVLGYKTYIPPKSIFSDDEFKIIERLQKDNNIYLIKPDKGNGVVIINRMDYNSRMLNILDDNTKFERINLKKSNIYKEITRRAVRTLIRCCPNSHKRT